MEQCNKEQRVLDNALNHTFLNQKNTIYAKKAYYTLIEDGTIKPSIYKVLPITNAEAAHAILERGENVGKVVLSVCDE